jgi:hypothetical protein
VPTLPDTTLVHNVNSNCSARRNLPLLAKRNDFSTGPVLQLAAKKLMELPRWPDRSGPVTNRT